MHRFLLAAPLLFILPATAAWGTLARKVQLIQSVNYSGWTPEVQFSPTQPQLVWLDTHDTTDRLGKERRSYAILAYDYQHGRLIWSVRPHDDVSDLVFSPDGKTLAYLDPSNSSAPPKIRFLDAASGRLKHTLSPQKPYEAVAELAYSPDGRSMNYGSFGDGKDRGNPGYDNAVVSLNLKNGRKDHIYRGLRWGHVSGIATSPDGSLIAATTYASHIAQSELAVWSTRSGKRLYKSDDADNQAVFLTNRRLLTRTRILTFGRGRASMHQGPRYLRGGVIEPDAFAMGGSSNNRLALAVKNVSQNAWKAELWEFATSKRLFGLKVHALNGPKITLSSKKPVFAVAQAGTLRIWSVR